MGWELRTLLALPLSHPVVDSLLLRDSVRSSAKCLYRMYAVVRPVRSMNVLFYLDLKVFVVKRRLSRLMDRSSGAGVRHAWGLKSHPFTARGTLASSVTSPSLIYKMGMKPLSED